MYHFYPRSTTRFSQSLAVIVDFCRANRSRPGGLYLLAFLLFLSNRGLAQDWNQIIKTAASDRRTLTSLGRTARDYFGYSVAIDGDYAVVGAYGDKEDASGGNPLQNAGSAIVFKRVNGTWTQIKKLVASDRAAGDEFGFSVAISGGLIVVGADADDQDASGGNTITDAGSAYVFSQNQGGADNWGQVKKIVANDQGAEDLFGLSVAISGNLIVVGAYQEDEDASGTNTVTDAGSAYVFSRNQGGTDNWGQVKKLVASDRGAGDLFGNSVSISGSLIVVGAYREDENTSGTNTITDAGSAYVFSQNQGGADNWGQVKKLVPSDRGGNYFFGWSVSISGSLIVVAASREEGASGGNTLTDAGAAYVFSQNQGGADNWGPVKKLVASDQAAGDAFGWSVSISGSLIVVAASREEEDALGSNTLAGAGSAYVFSQNQGGANNWGQVKKIVAYDRGANDQFGWSVGISGSLIVVGAYTDGQDASGGNTLTDAGSAYVFSQNQGGTDSWGQTQKVVLSDYIGRQNYGYSVAIDGDYAVVGAPSDYLDATSGQPLGNAGSAYVLKRQNGTWSQIQKLVASDRAIVDQFGWSVGISGSLIVVGAFQEDEDASGGNTLSAAGSAYVFSQNQGGTDNWGQVKKLVASDRAAGDYFGWSVGISGSQIVVGAYQEDEDASGGNTLTTAGSAYVFGQNQGGTNNWGQVKKLVASDRVTTDQFGYSVGISGSQIVVGAHQQSQDASGGDWLNLAGSAYVFSQNLGGVDNWGQVKKLVASDRAPYDQFGYSVGISGSQIVVGAVRENEDASGTNTLTDAGSAYVFGQDQGGTNNWGQVRKIVASDR
ncbi:FG-GAP repeat protein, partial [uncultured Spirosoma sp.]|uniref:FG-GAP repeat protein n=3 Tax=Spirosoma TaxID=107 RepID=UPI00261BA5F4